MDGGTLFFKNNASAASPVLVIENFSGVTTFEDSSTLEDGSFLNNTPGSILNFQNNIKLFLPITVCDIIPRNQCIC